MGLCSGFSVPISQSFGAKDFPLLRKMVTNSVWLCTFFSVVITTLMLLFCRPVLTWMNTPENIFEYAYIYIFIIFAGIPCTILYNMTAAILRALGDSKSPIIFLAISSAINIGLDLLLIIVFRMGVDGAALATVVSQGVSGVISIIYIKKKFDILAMEKGDWKLERHLAGKLTGVGIPMGLQYSITGIGSVILQTAVNGLGSIYVASMTAGSKINIFLACFIFAQVSRGKGAFLLMLRFFGSICRRHFRNLFPQSLDFSLFFAKETFLLLDFFCIDNNLFFGNQSLIKGAFGVILS